MATSSYSYDKKTNTITIVVAIPLPTGLLPDISISFPPKLPNLDIPLVPEAIRAIAKVLLQLQAIIDKLLRMIPGAAIRLIIKLGPVPVLDETFTTADAMTAIAALTICKK